LSGKGVLVGHNSIFPKQVNCVVVSLTDSEGKAVETTHGPFPWLSRAENPTGKTCLTRQRPRFSYFNLEPGEYVVRLTTPDNRAIGSHVVRVGSDRVSITVH